MTEWLLSVVIGGVLLGVAANELFELLPWFARKVLKAAAHLDASDETEAQLIYREHIARIQDLPGKLSPLCVAMSFLIKVALAQRVRSTVLSVRCFLTLRLALYRERSMAPSTANGGQDDRANVDPISSAPSVEASGDAVGQALAQFGLVERAGMSPAIEAAAQFGLVQRAGMSSAIRAAAEFAEWARTAEAIPSPVVGHAHWQEALRRRLGGDAALVHDADRHEALRRRIARLKVI